MGTLDIVRELISELGFPIAMVFYFIWDKTKITNQLVTAINNNNLILEKILTKCGLEGVKHE